MRALLAFVVALSFAGSTAVAQAKVLVTINKSTQQMEVSVDGETRHRWPVSTGRPGHDTPGGTYRAFRMEKEHYSREWDDAPMPHSIFFTKTGHAIHGSSETKKLGSPASAGCVRLAPENAEKLFALVEEHGVLNTTVEVSGDMRVALARSNPGTTSRPQREPQPQRPRYSEAPRRYYAQPSPYGQPYARQLPPPGYYYYEPQPYPRYYRW
jgi:hypothetical protein